jgi:hypothetical protein
VLAQSQTCSALGDPEALLNDHHRLAATLRGQKFPFATSLSMSMSSA